MNGFYEWLPLLLALCRGTSALHSSLQCTRITGRVSQIDASNGQVFGVNSFNVTFSVVGDGLLQYPGNLIAVSPGPHGIWSVKSNNKVARWLGGEWVEIGGSLTQIDAGGSHCVAGVINESVRCLPESKIILALGNQDVEWDHIEGKMKRISCGRYGCWAVDGKGIAYFRHGVTWDSCVGSRWTKEGRSLFKIDAGTDGGVYGLSINRHIFRRVGISQKQPAGTGWAEVEHNFQGIIDMSYDLGTLWIVAEDYSISKCIPSENENEEE